MALVRLCQFTPHLFSGGIEERVARVLAGFDRAVFDLTWMAFTAQGEANPALIARAGPKVDALVFRKQPSPLGLNPALVVSIAEAMRARRPDVVQIHNWSVSAYGILGARLAGVPKVVYEAAGRESPEGPTPRQLRVMRALAPYVDRFTSVCDFLSDELAEHWGVPRHKVSTMPTGVDVERVASASIAEQRARFGVPEDAVVVGTLGMLRPVKRVEDLIAAAAILARRHPKLWVLAIGNAKGTQPEDLKAQAAALGIGDRLILPGRVEDSWRAVRAIDVFVNCSIFEGASNAIIEAMAAELPVVATAVGGSPELVKDGENGLLVPPRAPEALAQAIGRLLDDEALRRKLGARGLERAQHEHTERRMIDAYADLYRNLAAEPKVPLPSRLISGARGLLTGLAVARG